MLLVNSSQFLSGQVGSIQYVPWVKQRSLDYVSIQQCSRTVAREDSDLIRF